MCDTWMDMGIPSADVTGKKAMFEIDWIGVESAFHYEVVRYIHCVPTRVIERNILVCHPRAILHSRRDGRSGSALSV